MDDSLKRRKLNAVVENKGSAASASAADETEHKILELLAEDNDQHSVVEKELFDTAWLQKSLLKVKKAAAQNTEVRTLYPNDPVKFLDSEYELSESLKILGGLSLVTDKSVIESFCKADNTLTLFSLIKAHPNIEIGNQILTIFNEILDDDIEETLRQSITDLFARTKFTFLLSDHIVEVSEKLADPLLGESVKIELTESLQIALEILIKLTENAVLNNDLVDNKRLVSFVLMKLSIKTDSQIDQIAQAYSELLSSMLTGIGEVEITKLTKLLEKHDIVETLMINFSKFSDANTISDTQKEEYIENLVDSLCYLLNISTLAKTQFMGHEGMELLFLMLSRQNNRWSVSRVFKILANALMGNDEASMSVADRLVSMGGLKHIFKNLKKGMSHNLLSIICSLFRLLELNSNERIRLLNKLMGKDGSNFKKLLSLRDKYVAIDSDARVEDLEKARLIDLILSWCLIDRDLGSSFKEWIPSGLPAILKASLQDQLDECQAILDAPPGINVKFSELIAANARDSADLLSVLISEL